jgi:coenzyme F420 hydrogenase subunit beta
VREAKGKSLRQLGQMFDRSHERIRQILAKYGPPLVTLLSEERVAAKLACPVEWHAQLRKEGIIKPIKPAGFWLYSEEQVRPAQFIILNMRNLSVGCDTQIRQERFRRLFRMGTKGSKDLLQEVKDAGLCTGCGGCAGGCPYWVAYKGRIVQIDNCLLTDGQCYQYCPRTFTDLEAISQKVFGEPFSDAEFGRVREIFLARSADPAIQRKSQDGGCVTTLLSVALAEKFIDGALETRLDADKVPGGFIARTKHELLECAGVSYEPSPILATINAIPQESGEKLAVVGLPCHIASVGKMKTLPPKHRLNIDNVKLTFGLFCGWELANGFHKFLQSRFDLSKVTKFDIPHHPAHSFDVYIDSQKISIDLDEINEYISEGCSYCWDMTSEFADISVGSGRAKFRGWNTVVVRSQAGAKLVDIARKKGALETQPIPQESVDNLKRAAMNKKRRAVSNLIAKSGDRNNLLYLGLPRRLAEKLKA